MFCVAPRKAGWFKVKPIHGSLSDTLDVLVIGGYFADSATRRDHVSHHDTSKTKNTFRGVFGNEQ